MNIVQAKLFATDAYEVVQPPMIKSPGAVVKLEMAVYVRDLDGAMHCAMQATDANTGELYEWRLSGVVRSRDDHQGHVAGWCERFQRMVEANTTPF